MRAAFYTTLITTLATCMLATTSFASDNPNELPWDLRDHFTFSMESSVMDYAVGNGEWRIVRDSLGAIIERADMEIHLADGRIISTRDLHDGKVVRKNFNTGTLRGIQYTITFSTVHGLTVRHAMTVHTGYPHMLIDVEVENGNAEPVEISAINPVVINPGSMALLSPTTTFTPRRLGFRGTTPMFSRANPPLGAWFEDDAQGILLGFAALPHGTAKTGTDFAFVNGNWQGVVASKFEPAIRLESGDSVRADSIWVCFALPTTGDLDTLLSWSHSERPRYNGAPRPPTSWASAAEGTPLDRLITSAGGWSSCGLKHVLIPTGWEGRPGSLEGGGGYPRSMERAASQLASTGLTPGITIDPLTGPQGDGAWSVLSSDGQRWLNLSHPGARAAAAQNIRTVASWGFQFIAVEPSRIPDEVLRTFKMTRAQADHLAFEVATEAAGSVPVVPTPTETLALHLPDWLEADDTSRRMMEYRLHIGPVRLELRGNEEISPELVAAIKEFSGAVELVGHPRQSVLSSLRGVFPRNNFNWESATAALQD